MIPMSVSSMANLQKLILLNIVTPAVASYTCMNPNALTLSGDYFSNSLKPPLFMSKAADGSSPYFLSPDKSCVGQVIVFEEHSGSYYTTFGKADIIPSTQPNASQDTQGISGIFYCG